MDLEWQERRGVTKTALDLTGLFQKNFTYQNADREMKLDADAALIPSRMRSVETKRVRAASWAYLENCKYVDHGYFSILEVHSLWSFQHGRWASAAAVTELHCCERLVKG